MEQNPFPMGSPVMARDMSGFPVGSPTQVVRSWRRVLYEKQPFEDNFVDTSLFMNELRQNENVHVHKYSDVMFATFPIAQQVACIVLFTKVFYSMLDREYSAVSLIGADATILLISWVVFVYMHFEDMMREDASFRQSGLRVKLVRILLIMFQFGRQLVALTSTLILLAPIITTLTATFTDDTIMAFSISAMFLNVILADYRYLSALTNRYQPNTSVNSAFFAVTMMASRFRSPLDGGAIMAFGAIVFALSPPARHSINKISRKSEAILTLLSFLASMWLMKSMKSLLLLLVIGLCVVMFVLPFFFVRLHSVKNQISGPWDEAKPKNSAAAAEWANSI
ncbi:phosphatidylinositol glycan, class C [Angomonas deanei]|uniref:Phosphatidylinositol N-acetylglucosaminyltransferase, putative n=1 Tax=Angomonas deanei TaxID=59799 RepID=S9W674_9TRYP|nr:phosphatidylinositol glycan, class C [Angomonas deanei]EPY41097.1 phosphatidylinositol glycan, class C [Angomonas deanei]CAD2214293.1 Phosphatidylinositol N-acetylglucosaminyltransferase, putative [Angomonas deanei]|eukprot:EPY31450.1 phosphatidylinositol glycan, class C [Angomonas deanei]